MRAIASATVAALFRQIGSDGSSAAIVSFRKAPRISCSSSSSIR